MFHVAIKTANAPIPVDATAEVLNVFLNLASVSLPYISETDFDITAKLLDPSESFDCESMRPKIRERLMPLGNVDPWRLLTIASDRDDLEMGRAAMNKMPWDPLRNFTVSVGTLWELAASLAGPATAPLHERRPPRVLLARGWGREEDARHELDSNYTPRELE
jgi:hypothetical protein